jgi:Tfp pilus assembly protein PilV
MIMDHLGKEKGYTLVETLIALFVGLLILGAVYASMTSGLKSSAAIERKIVVQQDSRSVMGVMALEIEMASYNPNYATGIWRFGPNGPSLVPAKNCGDLVQITDANFGFKGIQEATANSITVEMDIGESGNIGDSNNEIIRYLYDAGNLYMTRQADCAGAAMPFLGDLPGNPRNVRVMNDLNGNGLYDDGVDIPLFRYFDSLGNQIPYANLPGSIPLIRRIEITLAVETNEVDPNTMQRRRMIYSTSMIPRNHALSP